MEIIDLIKRNRTLYYICRCVRNVTNRKFVDEVLEIGKTYKMICVHHNGTGCPGKIIYYYKCGWEGGGFFGTFRQVLGALNYADQFGFVPVIEWNRSVPYYDNNMDKLTKNPFEYYFQQPGNMYLDIVNSASNLVIGVSLDSEFTRCNFGYYAAGINGVGYSWNIDRFRELAEAMKKYIRFNNEIKECLENDLKKLGINERTLGVHIRRLGFSEKLKYHPIPPELDEYIQNIDEMINSGLYDKIFIATEESNTIDVLKSKYGSCLVYYKDVFRNNEGNVHASFSDRPKHKFLLGYEVLRDMYTLTQCGSLLAGLSNVSMCAKIAKLSLDKDYNEERILDKGISSSNYTAQQFHKIKRLKRLR